MREPFELMHKLVGEFGSVMRMNASSRIQRSRMGVHKRDCLSGAFGARPGNDHLGDACSGGASHYSVTVAVITIVREIDPDIDECG